MIDKHLLGIYRMPGTAFGPGECRPQGERQQVPFSVVQTSGSTEAVDGIAVVIYNIMLPLKKGFS